MALTNIRLLEKRAEDHRESALVLVEAGNEWAAVASFYSCYQLARAALLADPVFEDLTELKAIHGDLIPDDRYAAKHQARKGSNQGFGMLDLVHALYKHVGNKYRTLHRGSVQVRYEEGLKSSSDS